MDKGLAKRLFNFAVRVIKYCRTLKYVKDVEIIKTQLIKSSTSSGANYEEAQAAISRPDFFNKINISLKEMRESNYWLRVLKEIESENEELIFLLNESVELKKILGSINSKNNK